MALALPMVSSAGEHAVHRGRTKPQCLTGIPARDYQYQSRSRSETVISRRAVLVEKSELSVEKEIERAEEIFRKRRPQLGEEGDRGTPVNGAQREPLALLMHPAVQVVAGRPGDIDLANSGHRLASQPPPCGPLPIAPYADGYYDVLPNGDTRIVDDVFVCPEPGRTRVSKKEIRLFQLEQPKLEIDHCSVSRVALQLHNDGTWVLSLRGDQNPRQEGEAQEFQPRLHLKRNLFVVRLRGYGNFAVEPTTVNMNAGKPELLDLNPVRFWVQNGEPRYLRVGGHDCRVHKFYELIDRVEVEFYYR
jgi:hypothetical protein